MRKKRSSGLTFSDRMKRDEYAPAYPLVKCVLFFLLLAVGCILAFILPLRPTYSDSEKRELAKFPTFSVAALTSGDYFRDMTTWFSDTFPFREQLVTINGYLESAHGLHPVQIYDDGDSFDNDEIPDTPTRPTAVTTVTNGSATATLPPTSAVTSPSTTAPTTTTPTTGSTTAPTTAPTTVPTTVPPVSDNVQQPATQTLGAILVANDAAYEYYSFSKAAADKYIALINRTGAKLDGIATVYDLLVPTGMDIALDEAIRKDVKSADQEKAKNYIYGSLDSRVKAVDVFATLREHKDEYLYFRTDHHWTATGAYYAYTQFAAAKGVATPALTDYPLQTFEGFLGSFYSKTDKSPALGKNPDTVYAYKPLYPTTMQFTDRSGNTRIWPVIADVTNWSASGKYNTFIGGDNPFTVITNTALSDGSACAVVKESYGNAFVPFLVSHYQTVYVIDYRYYEGDLTTFVKDNKVQDVIFVNNMSATRSSNLVGSMDTLVGE